MKEIDNLDDFYKAIDKAFKNSTSKDIKKLTPKELRILRKLLRKEHHLKKKQVKYKRKRAK